MSPLARWCHRHRFAVVLACLGGPLACPRGRSWCGQQRLRQRSDLAEHRLRQGHGPAAAGHEQRGGQERPSHLAAQGRRSHRTRGREGNDRRAGAPSPAHRRVAAVTSPYTPLGRAQFNKDGRMAYATVTFDRDVADAQIDHVKELATAPKSEKLRIALNGQAFTVNPAPNPVADVVGIALAFVVLLFVLRTAPLIVLRSADEICDDMVLRMVNAVAPVASRIEPPSSGPGMNYEGLDTTHLTFEGAVVFRTGYEGGHVSDDDISVAELRTRRGQ
ncbi:MMPL family transporter [Streptomyces sp. NPDC048385]|uniref:MMPL family transporter n=1 Tax=Streptomyces sp. NPDC048385 TaxID=3155145 RepID=UPI003427EAC9